MIDPLTGKTSSKILVHRPMWAVPVGCLLFLFAVLGLVVVAFITFALSALFFASALSMMSKEPFADDSYYLTLSAGCLVGLLTLMQRWRLLSASCAAVLLLSAQRIAWISDQAEYLFLAFAAGPAFVGFCHLLAIMLRIADSLTGVRYWRARNLANHRCPACGYDIRSLPTPRCPECGETW